jgi:flagellin-like hook-associated protein FlgL
VPITVASNIASLGAQRQLGKVSESLSSSFDRLSSGLRITRASDDAAGLAISSSLKSDGRIFTQAIRNLNDGISILSVAEGAITQLSEIITRQAELAAQAANGTYALQQRAAMQAEADALSRERTRIVRTVSFNGIRLLDDNATPLFLQAGRGDNTVLSTDVSDTMRQTVGLGTFAAQVTINTGLSGGRSLAAVDVNNDAIVDIVTIASDYPAFSVSLGNGDGTFRAAVSYAMGGNAYGLAIGDYNGDGSLDVATADFSGNSVSVRLNQGNGTYGTRVSYATGISSPTRIEQGDVTGDGVLDLVIRDSQGLKMLQGVGNGTFGSVVTVVSGSMSGLSVSDMNRDGKADVISSSAGISSIYSFSGGSFSQIASFNPGGTAGGNTVADFNRDGRPDVFSYGGALASAQVFLQQANGSFANTNVTYTSIGSNEEAVTVNDFNNDGYLDIARINNTNPGSLNMLLGNGDGTFQVGVSMASGAQPEGIAAGDFNRDGALDIVTGSAAGSDIFRIHIAQTRRSGESEMYNLFTQTDARSALDSLRAALTRMSLQQGVIGSSQSRFQVALQTLAVSRENYIRAASQIEDTDVAQEAAELIRKNIVQQAASQVLTQANLQPQLVLKLLQ